MSDIGVSQDGYVATVEIRRPPHNFFDSALIAEIGEAFERLDADSACRAIVLAAEGRSFCAGADFSKRMDTGTVQESARSGGGRHLYKEAIRLFRTQHPGPVFFSSQGSFPADWSAVFGWNMLAMMLLGTVMTLVRLGQENAQRELDSLRRTAHAI